MLFAFMHRVGNEPRPDLCLIADKPDEFSVPVSVDSLPVTNSAVCRLGPHEAVSVTVDDEGAKIIIPVVPSKMYITPSQPDQAGRIVARIKVLKIDEGSYRTWYQQEKDLKDNKWNEWDPNSR